MRVDLFHGHIHSRSLSHWKVDRSELSNKLDYVFWLSNCYTHSLCCILLAEGKNEGRL